MSPFEPFRIEGLRGEIESRFRPAHLEAELARLTDPGAAVASIHWGRNYLYRAVLALAEQELPVVVKQFREDSWRGRLSRRLKGSKARRAWNAARALLAAGLPTPEPVLFAESERPGGPSFYVCRHVENATELRYLLRSARAGTGEKDYPRWRAEEVLTELGRLLRLLHEAGVWHRDASVGNFLIVPQERPPHFELTLVDLSRARLGRPLSRAERFRDLSRLALDRQELREALLAGYFGAQLSPAHRRLFDFYQGAFEAKNRWKKPGKSLAVALKSLAPRRAHAHIPEAPSGAGRRDKVVWDRLSDQPHQHAGRLEKLLVRLADAPSHLEQLLAIAAAAPRIRARYRRLKAELYREEVPFEGVGLALRPYPEDPQALLDAVEDLGVRKLLLRLHPWQLEHGEEEALARELHARGYELAFALPQNRELVKNLPRWRSAVAELVEAFSPFGRQFQIGQAINRSKWGVWRPDEYIELARAALEVLRSRPGLEAFGPAVIDFEPQALAGLLNLRRRDFALDGVASLLYVDRRGAPENRQLGFDAVGKALLMKAIADTARNARGRLWVTEVNWPLWEGPHSPAGKSVAVSEQEQASYLARYYLELLATGQVERIYWWQLVARGYGLICPEENGQLRRRAAFRALAELARRLPGATSLGPLPSPTGTRLYRFRLADGHKLAVAWSTGPGPQKLTLPRPAQAAFELEGAALGPQGESVEALPAPRWFRLES